MPGDVQLTALQTKDAPLTYKVPGSALIRLKSIRAEFTDDGASGDWLPAVQLVSDSGHIIATASDQGAKVTAGDDADASFFPGVKHAATSSAATVVTPVAYVQYDSNAFPAGTSHPNITAIHNNVPGFVTAGGGGANPFTINTNGMYLFEFAVAVDNTHATTETVNCIVEGADQPNFLTGVVAFLSAVIPANGAPRSASYDSASVGQVSDAFSNVVNLGVTCSASLTVQTPVLAISQLSTGLVF